MKKLLFAVVGLCLISILFSIFSFGATVFDVHDIFTNYQSTSSASTVSQGNYLYSDLGVNWQWSGNTYFYHHCTGANVKVQYESKFLWFSNWNDLTSSAFCAEGLNNVYCIRWTGVNNNKTLRFHISPVLVANFPEDEPIPAPPPDFNSYIFLQGYLATLSEQ